MFVPQHNISSSAQSSQFDCQAVVISLDGTAARLELLQQNFAGSSTSIPRIKGINGQAIDYDYLIDSNCLDPTAFQWPKGQVGCGLSHLKCMIKCYQSNKPWLIFEDDVIPSLNWEQELSSLLISAPIHWDFLLLGWNFDSCLQIEWPAGLTMTGLFQPRFPSDYQIKQALSLQCSRQWYRLHRGLGLAAYLVSPRGAAKILQWALPLRTLPIKVHELPERDCFSFDGQLNSIYSDINAWVCTPPLFVGGNDKSSSLTAE